MKLEKDLEERCRLLAEQRDGKLLKFKPPQKGWHDRLLLLPGYMALVEFKRHKKAKVQNLQDDRQAWCAARAIPAFRVWEYEQFVEIVNKNGGCRGADGVIYRSRMIWPAACICAFGKPNPDCQAKVHGGRL